MKVVGGPRDGWACLHPGKRDYFVPVLAPESVTDFLCSERGRLEPVQITTTRYTVRTLRSSDEQLLFLAPDDWSDLKAIKYQFAK